MTEYLNCYGKLPERNVFHEYFMLFSSPESAQVDPVFVDKMKYGNRIKNAANAAPNREPLFDTFDDFIEACFKNDDK